MLKPSTITALRTRRYDSTWYIPGTIHRFENAPMDGEGGTIFNRRLHQWRVNSRLLPSLQRSDFGLPFPHSFQTVSLSV